MVGAKNSVTIESNFLTCFFFFSAVLVCNLSRRGFSSTTFVVNFSSRKYKERLGFALRCLLKPC